MRKCVEVIMHDLKDEAALERQAELMGLAIDEIENYEKKYKCRPGLPDNWDEMEARIREKMKRD